VGRVSTWIGHTEDGVDGAGIVEAVGGGATRFSLRDEIFG
jgi:hypothetical protein